ncbi:MAG: Arsenical pump membrane protein [Candidatus Thorarchaeota archaeon AB_25]|nr:MAG: Arsenical pump membrane protein [Candidatus Thorarchaeota archaeon AB_25]
MNATMKQTRWEIIAAIVVLIMIVISIGLVVAYHNVALAIIVVFIGTYVLISTEKVNRTAMALLGMSLAGFIFWVAMEIQILVIEHPFEVLIAEIEWTTIIFIIAMSMIVSVAAASGLFQFIALKIAARSEGNHKKLFITFLVFVSGISLFFDTVSTMLIAAPLTIEICKALEIDFKPFLISEAIVCNFSSIPSLVGAVPNLVIAGQTGLDVGFLFVAFMPLSIILFLVSLPILLRWFSSTFGSTDEHRIDAVFSIDPATMIKDKWDFNISAVAIIILVIGFAIGPGFGLFPPMVAIFVAGFLLLLAHERANEFLNRVGWPTVFFLVGLFGLVGALSITGLIEALGNSFEPIIGDDPAFALVFLTWIPAMLSAFLDNLPVAAVLAPIAVQFAGVSPILPLALVFAVNIGGYIFTPLGSPANMVVIGLSEREHDPISFIEFVKIGTILGLIHLTIGSGYLLLLNALIGG